MKNRQLSVICSFRVFLSYRETFTPRSHHSQGPHQVTKWSESAKVWLLQTVKTLQHHCYRAPAKLAEAFVDRQGNLTSSSAQPCFLQFPFVNVDSLKTSCTQTFSRFCFQRNNPENTYKIEVVYQSGSEDTRKLHNHVDRFLCHLPQLY